jgi:hypothetical protein
VAFDALVKPIVDALLKALDRARDSRLKASARKALGEAISELIRIDVDVDKAEAKIAVARAAGILDRDLFTAERMLRKIKKSAKKKAAKKPAAKRRVRRVGRKTTPRA